MKITKKTRKSHVWNEDRFVVGKNFLMVIDGATPLIKEGTFNSACWLVNFLKKNLTNFNGNVLEKLEELSKIGLEEIPLKEKSSDYLPSASMSFIEFNKNKALVYLLGDCEVVLRYKDGQVVRYYNDSLNHLDTISLNELKQHALEKQLPIAKCRPYIVDTLIKHRRLINKEGGYHAYTLGLNKVEADVFQLNLDNVLEIYLYSDGFSQSFQHLNIYNSVEELFNHSIDLDEEIEKIVLRAFGDKDCNKYPRFKVIDDITIIKAELEK